MTTRWPGFILPSSMASSNAIGMRGRAGVAVLLHDGVAFLDRDAAPFGRNGDRVFVDLSEQQLIDVLGRKAAFTARRLNSSGQPCSLRLAG